MLESQPAIPAVIMLLVGTFGDALFPCHWSAIDAIHGIISDGGDTILIYEGGMDGWSEVGIEMSCSYER